MLPKSELEYTSVYNYRFENVYRSHHNTIWNCTNCGIQPISDFHLSKCNSQIF
jgi:hypothetical protein